MRSLCWSWQRCHCRGPLQKTGSASIFSTATWYALWLEFLYSYPPTCTASCIVLPWCYQSAVGLKSVRLWGFEGMRVSIRNGRRLHYPEQARALTSVRKRKKILSLERTGCDATRSRKFSRPTLRLSTKSGSRLSADSLCHTNSAYKRHNSRG